LHIYEFIGDDFVFTGNYSAIDQKYLKVINKEKYKTSLLVVGINSFRSIHDCMVRGTTGHYQLFVNLFVQFPFNLFSGYGAILTNHTSSANQLKF
jgi:hypothetical protein